MKTEYPNEYKDCKYRGNCAHFVKYEKRVTFPDGTNLSTWEGKVKLYQDSEHGRSVAVCPETGWVAIVDTRNSQPKDCQVGHIAYVKDADEEDRKITVVTLDGNWINGKVYRRTGTPKELSINSYWAP